MKRTKIDTMNIHFQPDTQLNRLNAVSSSAVSFVCQLSFPCSHSFLIDDAGNDNGGIHFMVLRKTSRLKGETPACKG